MATKTQKGANSTGKSHCSQSASKEVMLFFDSKEEVCLKYVEVVDTTKLPTGRYERTGTEMTVTEKWANSKSML